MWRYKPFVEFLSQLVSCDQVDEIILIDNDTARTPNAQILSHKKIKSYNFGRNIFVNPAWNFGVHVSRNDSVCILNDDVSFDLRLFDRVAAVLSEHTGAIGMCPGLPEFNQPPYTNGNIDVVPWQGEHTFGFGCIMCIHKSWWTDIPDGLAVYYGDQWIFDACMVRGRTPYLITNLEQYSPYASTTSSVATREMLDTESVVYQDSFDNFRNMIYVESTLKHSLSLEHARQQPERITVVVPTMWRHGAFLDFAQDFLQLDCVERLIIINNDETKTPIHPILSSDKVTMIGHGRNIFVNPAWNLGVNTSETPIVCILNDDLNFDIRLFQRVSRFFKPGMGAIGLSNGIQEYGQTPLTDGMIQFEPFNGQACFGFGNLMFVRQETWRDIPPGLDIFFGDNFIFDYNYFAERVNYFIVNMFHHHAASTTVDEIFGENTHRDLFDRENSIYAAVKSKIIDKTL
jgi:glycosyltransferase involved in cell wall biosynthesis